MPWLVDVRVQDGAVMDGWPVDIDKCSVLVVIVDGLVEPVNLYNAVFALRRGKMR